MLLIVAALSSRLKAVHLIPFQYKPAVGTADSIALKQWAGETQLGLGHFLVTTGTGTQGMNRLVRKRLRGAEDRCRLTFRLCA
jgi:hypothetical protein